MMPQTMADHLLLSSMDDLVECTNPNCIYILNKYIFFFYILYHIFMRSNYTLDDKIDMSTPNSKFPGVGTAFCLDDLYIRVCSSYFPYTPRAKRLKGLEACNANPPPGNKTLSRNLLHSLKPNIDPKNGGFQ